MKAFLTLVILSLYLGGAEAHGIDPSAGSLSERFSTAGTEMRSLDRRYRIDGARLFFPAPSPFFETESSPVTSGENRFKNGSDRRLFLTESDSLLRDGFFNEKALSKLRFSNFDSRRTSDLVTAERTIATVLHLLMGGYSSSRTTAR